MFLFDSGQKERAEGQNAVNCPAIKTSVMQAMATVM